MIGSKIDRRRAIYTCSLRALFSFIFLFGLAGVAQSQPQSDNSKSSTSQLLTVDYPAFSEPLSFNVSLPASYHKLPDKHYFVLFDIHPRSHQWLSGSHDWLSHNGEWPWLETIIVTAAGYHPEFAALFTETAEQPDDSRLLDVLEKHVLAEIHTTYRTNGFTMYSGFMSNAAIGLYALLNRPDMFNAYFLATPTLNDDFLNIMSTAPHKLEALKDKSRFINLVIGQHNYEKNHIDEVESLRKFFSDKAPESLDWHITTNDPHYYMTRPIITVINGIERLFDDYHNDLAPDSDISSQGPDAIIKYYQFLSKQKYGFEVSAEGSLKKLAKSWLASDPERSISLYRQVAERYPDSAYAHADLASAYAQRGLLDEAIIEQKIAVEKSKSLVPFHQKKMAKQLDALIKKLSENQD